MKHYLSFFTLCFLSLRLLTAQVVFEDKYQRWEYQGMRHTNEYTALQFEITIMSKSAGCFDAHLYDKTNSSIYIEGVFGRFNLFKSVYEGDYEPWIERTGYKNWDYFDNKNKGKKASATLYFSRVPAGVTSLNFYFYGGWANEEADCEEFECPKFQVRNVTITDNADKTIKSGWQEPQLRARWNSSSSMDSIEGIYSFYQTNNQQWWGNFRHRIAIKKNTDFGGYDIIYLAGSNDQIWNAGEVKGKLSPSGVRGLYKVDTWLIENKMPSTADFYFQEGTGSIKLRDNQTNNEVLFLKLFPESK